MPNARSRACVLGQPNAFGVLEPMAEAGRLAHAAGALLRGRRGAGLARRPGAAGRVRRRHRGRGGPAARHRAPVRRAVPGHAGRTEALMRQIPGRLVGRTTRPRWPARVRHDAARPRAGHPPRQGGQQHLHQPGALRAGRDRVPRDARAARPARRRRRRRRPGPRGWRRRWRMSAHRASTRRRISTSSPSACPTPARSTPRCSTTACWPGCRWRAGTPTTPSCATRCWCAPPRSPRPTRSSGSRARSRGGRA